MNKSLVDNEHARFKMIYWFIVGCSTAAFLYIVAITFLTVPESSQRFADTAQGFFLATLIAGCLNYLLGGSPANVLHRTKEAQVAGTPGIAEITAEIKATKTTEPDKTSNL